MACVSKLIASQLFKYLLVPALVGGLVGLCALLVINARNPQQPSPGFADAVSRAAPAVVNIYSSKIIQRKLHPLCGLPLYRDLCQNVIRSDQRMQKSLGSGVVVSSDGYILTNHHVIEGANEILVAFPDGVTNLATLVGTDPETDLAVIKVDAVELEAINIGSSDTTRVGDTVLAIGNPFGIGQTVSMGIISAKGRTGVSTSPYEDFLQTDAAINPGNSGGALIDAQGRLVGINSLIYSRTGNFQGISFAIPVKIALEVVNQIVTEGEVIRGWLGIEAQAGQINQPGLVVTKVIPDGPAHKAGLERGDRIVSVNEQPAINLRVVTQQIAYTEPGTTVALDVIRNGQKLALRATSGTRPNPLAP